jgi:hypothetical protein
LDKRVDAGNVEAGVENGYEDDTENHTCEAADASSDQDPSDNGGRDREKLVSLPQAPLSYCNP